MFRQPTVESLGTHLVDGKKDGTPPPTDASGDAAEPEPLPEPTPPNEWGISEDGFGILLGEVLEGDLEGLQTGEPVTRYTLTNKNGLSVQVINYGVTVTSIVVPDRNGVFDDIALGFDDFEGYLKHANYWIGSTVGRVANVVSRARFQMDGRMYELSVDEENVHKHGGAKGFSKVLWGSSICRDHVVFTHLSADGEDGYPGNLMVTIKMSLGDDNALRTIVTATTDRPTPVDIGNHTCFNLAGHMFGPEEIGNHVIVLNADKWLCADDDGVPTGEIKHVGCTLMDLRIHRVLSRLIPLVPVGGYDHTFVVNGARQDGVRFVGRLLHPKSGRVLEVFSDQPAVHLYTGKNLGYPIVEEPVDEEAEAALAASLDNQVASTPHLEDVEPEPEEPPPTEPESMAEPEPVAEEPVVEGEPAGEGEIAAELPGEEGAAEGDDIGSVNLEEIEPEVEEGPKIPVMTGKGGALYEKNGCFSLMTHAYTDAVNKHHFPEIVLRPGETYTHTTVLKFAVCVKTRKFATEALANSPPEPEPSELSLPGSMHSGDSRRSGSTRLSGDETPYPPFEEVEGEVVEGEPVEGEDAVVVPEETEEPVAVEE